MDLSKFLDELGATGEDRANVEKFFTANPTAAQKATGWFENGLRQSDYDRKMNMLKAEVEAQKATLTQAEQTLLASRDTMNTQYTTALADREAAESKLAALQARIKNVATTYQVPVDEFGIPKDGDPPPVRKEAQPNNPNNDFVSKNDFSQLAELTKKLPMLPVQLMKLQREHFELTGTHFDEMALVEKSLELQKPVEQVADLMFGLSQKRTEKHDAAIRADERAKAEVEMKAKYSREGANPIRTDLNVQPSAVFKLSRPEPQGVPGPRPDRLQSGVEAAVNAFREGKYRPHQNA